MSAVRQRASLPKNLWHPARTGCSGHVAKQGASDHTALSHWCARPDPAHSAEVHGAFGSAIATSDLSPTRDGSVRTFLQSNPVCQDRSEPMATCSRKRGRSIQTSGLDSDQLFGTSVEAKPLSRSAPSAFSKVSASSMKSCQRDGCSWYSCANADSSSELDAAVSPPLTVNS